MQSERNNNTHNTHNTDTMSSTFGRARASSAVDERGMRAFVQLSETKTAHAMLVPSAIERRVADPRLQRTGDQRDEPLSRVT